MTNEQILKKAILKAYPDKKFQDQEDLADYVKGQLERDEGYRLIFWHDFAEKFWGEEKDCCIRCSPIIIKKRNQLNYYKNCPQCDNCWQFLVYRWQYHLQQMVLEKEPLKYLEKFL